MADGIFPTIISKNRDANAQDNVMFVQLSDGTNVLNTTAGSLNVHITTTDFDIRDLDNSQDNILVYGFDGTDNQPIKTDANGELQVDVLTMPTINIEFSQSDDDAFDVGVDKVGVAGYLADETSPDSVDEGDVGAARMTLDRKQLFVLVDKTTDANRLTINASGEAYVSLQSHTLTNANALPISKDNNANSETNPLYVQTVNTGVSGSEVHNFNTATVASDSTSNHDYTVAGSTFLLKSIIVAGSGNVKFEIKVGALAGLVTKAVGFLTGRAGDSKQINFDPAIEVPATGTGTIRVIRTNRENQSTDVYSTIIGNDVA